jgi:hypothetical protein
MATSIKMWFGTLASPQTVAIGYVVTVVIKGGLSLCWRNPFKYTWCKVHVHYLRFTTNVVLLFPDFVGFHDRWYPGSSAYPPKKAGSANSPASAASQLPLGLVYTGWMVVVPSLLRVTDPPPRMAVALLTVPTVQSGPMGPKAKRVGANGGGDIRTG